MIRLGVLLACCLCNSSYPYAAAAPAPPTILDQVVIEAKGTGVEIRHPSFNGSGAKLTVNEKKGLLVLEGTVANPAMVSRKEPMDAERKVYRGLKIKMLLKDGKIDSVSIDGN